MALRVGILGRGRLGGLVDVGVRSAPDLELAWTVGRHEAAADPVDVAVDVSHADVVPAHLDWAATTGTDLVIGTTGWDEAELESHDLSGIGVLVAPNFSLTVALLRRLSLVLGRYAARSPEPVDLAVLDRHHRGKVDAPSGTARLLATALGEGSRRPTADVGVVSQRLGAVVGLHEVRWQTPSESLAITHEVHSREVFAQGALTAARWVHGRRGVFTMDDLAADLLDGLFADLGTTPDGTATRTPAGQHPARARKPMAHAAPTPA